MNKILVLWLSVEDGLIDLDLINILSRSGALVSYSDPYVPVLPKTRAFHFDMVNVELTGTVLAAQDAVVVATDHSNFDYDTILEGAKLIIDTRGVYRDLSNKVIRS